MSSPAIHTLPVENQSYYYPSNYLRSKVDEFTIKTDEFADQFFAPEKNTNHTVVHHHHYHSYSPFYSPWLYYSPWYVNPVIIPDRGHRRNDNDEGGRIFLAIIAVVGALVASYTIGIALSCLNEAGKELNKTKEFERDLSDFQKLASPQDQLFLAEAQRAALLKEKICTRITNSAAWDLALRVTVAAGLVLTAVGAALLPVAAPALGVGISLTIISLAAMLFKWGFESHDKDNIHDAQTLKAMLVDLKKL